jgi:hypothetical protein
MRPSNDRFTRRGCCQFRCSIHYDSGDAISKYIGLTLYAIEQYRLDFKPHCYTVELRQSCGMSVDLGQKLCSISANVQK